MVLFLATVALAAPRFTELEPGVTLITADPWESNAVLVDLGASLVLVDTPPAPEDTRAVLAWARERYGDRPLVAVNTHWHIDASGGNQVLVAAGVPVWGHADTAVAIRERGPAARDDVAAEFAQLATWVPTPPDKTFTGSRHELPGVVLIHPGHAHTADNIVAWFPERRLLFGGCLVKTGPDLGNIAGADLTTYDDAIVALQALKPRLVIQGHGAPGHPDPLGHTAELVPKQPSP